MACSALTSLDNANKDQSENLRSILIDEGSAIAMSFSLNNIEPIDH